MIEQQDRIEEHPVADAREFGPASDPMADVRELGPASDPWATTGTVEMVGLGSCEFVRTGAGLHVRVPPARVLPDVGTVAVAVRPVRGGVNRLFAAVVSVDPTRHGFVTGPVTEEVLLERRRAPRAPVRVDVWLGLMRNHEAIEAHGRTVDLSTSGVAILLDDPLLTPKAGEHAVVRIAFHDGPLLVPCRVARSEPGLVGIELHVTDRIQRDRLIAHTAAESTGERSVAELIVRATGPTWCWLPNGSAVEVEGDWNAVGGVVGRALDVARSDRVVISAWTGAEWLHVGARVISTAGGATRLAFDH